MTQKSGREPTDEELGEALNLPPKKVRYLLEIGRQPASLNEPTQEEDSGSDEKGDCVASQGPEAFDIVADSCLKEEMEEVLGRLDPRSARILHLRYGLKDGRAYTLEEVGRKFGLTRERIRQIEAEALRILRHPSVTRRLKAYLQK